VGKETGRQSLARSFPAAACQAHVPHHRASHVHAFRLLGTQYLASRISLRSPLAGRRRTQHPALVGFFGTGFFSLFGTMLAELYPTSIRGSAQGFVYNTGRAASALAPFAIGAIADRHGLGYGLALNSAFFLIGAALIFTLPETKGTHLA